MIGTRLLYCPFCGKKLYTLSLRAEYEQACDEPEADELDWDSETEVEAFRRRFLAKHEGREQSAG